MTQLDLFGRLRRAVATPKRAVAPPRAVLRQPQIVPVDLGGSVVDVHVHTRPGARNFTLSLMRSGQAVRLTLPPRARLADGLAFVREKRSLVLSWLAAAPRDTWLRDGATLLFKGELHEVRFRAGQPRGVVLDSPYIDVGGPVELAAGRAIRWLKRMALADLTATAQSIAATHGLTFSTVRVTSAVARWGSCSSSGRINFSWRLICAPDAARHYVVAHELAHLAQMNHSPAFWLECARLGGDLSQRAWFRQHGAAVLALH